MTTTINASASAGLITTADTSTILQLQTNGTAALTVDTSQNIGIGTASPSYKLDILTGGGGVYAAQFGNGTAAQGMRIVTGMDSTSSGITTAGGTRLIQFDGTNNITQFYTNASERMRIDSSGRLGVGATPSSWVTSWTPIDYGNSSGIASPNDGNNIICGNTYFNGSNWIRKTATYAANIECNALGKIATYTSASSTAGSTVTWTTGPYVANLGTSWTNSSDERLKDIIEPITDATNKVGQLRAVIGKFKTDPDDKRRSFLIAQDVQAVLPEAVDATDPDSLGVQYTDVIPLLVAAIKEQQALITQLQADVAALKGATA